MAEKVWWRVARRDEQHKIRDMYTVRATSRKEAKELAAQYWQLDTLSHLTALSDRSMYNYPDYRDE
jgi:hypothetical protein